MKLKHLIKQLFIKHGLKQDIHFDVWPCEINQDNKLDKDHPLWCSHFIDFTKSKDGTDVFNFLECRVEKYEFEILNDINECHLFVKLQDVNKKTVKKYLY